VSRILTSVNRDLLSRPPPNETLANAQSRKWLFPAVLSSNEAPEKR
jgi:hypothetical protein